MMLSSGMREVLQMMADADPGDYYNAEIVCDGLQCYIGSRSTSRRTVTALLRHLAISENRDGKMARYTINETGRAILRRPEIISEIERALLTGGSWTIRDDKIVHLPSPVEDGPSPNSAQAHKEPDQ